MGRRTFRAISKLLFCGNLKAKFITLQFNITVTIKHCKMITQTPYYFSACILRKMEGKEQALFSVIKLACSYKSKNTCVNSQTPEIHCVDGIKPVLLSQEVCWCCFDGTARVFCLFTAKNTVLSHDVPWIDHAAKTLDPA